jgi:hypothetical protein
MKRPWWLVLVAATAGAVVVCISLSACNPKAGAPNPIVGTWVVEAKGAPFSNHVFSFHDDGTMLQANPDAGDTNTSDSIGMGVWRPDGDHIKGKFVEMMASRDTGAYASRGEIAFDIKPEGDGFHGMASARFYGPDGTLLRGPVAALLEGRRVRAD